MVYMKKDNFVSLRHHFLIAMPNLQDSYFSQSVVYLVEHSPKGAMGLIINQPSGLNLSDILQQLRPENTAPTGFMHSVHNGGPVDTGRGFVLHSAEQSYRESIELNGLRLSTSQDVLFAIADQQDAPVKSLIALGFAGWDAGQLEQELAANSWLTVLATEQIIFDTPATEKRAQAAALLGINLNQLSTQVGHA